MANVAKNLEPEFRRIFSVLMTGSPAKFKQAKKDIEKLWSRQNVKEFKKSAPIALEYIEQFDQIKSPKNQAAFASGLRLFFWFWPTSILKH